MRAEAAGEVDRANKMTEYATLERDAAVKGTVAARAELEALKAQHAKTIAKMEFDHKEDTAQLRRDLKWASSRFASPQKGPGDSP